MKQVFTAVAAALLFAAPARAHYHMLIPDRHSVKSGESVVVTYQFGHPFEHQLFDAAAPASALIYAPDGKAEDVKTKLTKIELPGDGKKAVTAYRLTFKPQQRGDHVLVFASGAVTIEGEKQPVFDVVKVVIHVQTQQGWDTRKALATGQAVDLQPLTRPYGLRPGMLFRAAFIDAFGKQLTPTAIAHAEVEIELYHSTPPKELPPDEHTTYTARTDDRGILAATLPDAGWWAVTAIRQSPQAMHRCTFWVPVDGKIPLKPAD